jgi:hypothetical protein
VPGRLQIDIARAFARYRCKHIRSWGIIKRSIAGPRRILSYVNAILAPAGFIGFTLGELSDGKRVTATIFLAKLLGLYCAILALAMMVRGQSAAVAMNDYRQSLGLAGR